MKTKDLRQKSDEDLLTEARNLREGIFNKKFQTEIEQISSPALVVQMRRDLARIKTVLRERGLKVEV